MQNHFMTHHNKLKYEIMQGMKPSSDSSKKSGSINTIYPTQKEHFFGIEESEKRTQSCYSSVGVREGSSDQHGGRSKNLA